MGFGWVWWGLPVILVGGCCLVGLDRICGVLGCGFVWFGVLSWVLVI